MEKLTKRTMPYRALRKIGIILEMIKFEHTLFALPFALIGALVAARGLPDAITLLWIIAAMVGARSAAMAFNRIADNEYDRRNPRTAKRAIPSGLISSLEAWAFTLVSAALLVFAAYMLNPLAFALSPVALLVILGYSYTKRFTAWSHVVLGLALAIAPSGAWIAVKGTLELAPMILSLAVILWTAGFDIIYSLQDVEFDKKTGLRSLPQAIGTAWALMVSRLFHALMVGAALWFGLVAELGPLFYGGVGMVAAFLVCEHRLVSPTDISRVNTAFFTLNGFVSVGLLLFVVLDLFVK